MGKERAILHVDCDKFYASVEVLHHPEVRDKPVVVGGDPELRHGIVLTRNEIAKRYGIKTGETLWMARNKCPELIVFPPNYVRYIRFSKLVRGILADYTDLIEPFGIDESWIDVTGSVSLFGDAVTIAKEIQQRVWDELGITVSIGVSWNKVYAKLGSDYQKPKGITVINRDNYQQLVYPLPAADLLYVGRATAKKLYQHAVSTIGQIAGARDSFLHALLGKWGIVLKQFALGKDTSPVNPHAPPVKSIGNSTTTPRDLTSEEDVKAVLYVLAESIARRMRELGFKGRTVSIYVRDNQLASFTRQTKMEKYTNLTGEIAKQALELFKRNYYWQNPIRSVGINVSDFEHERMNIQLDLFHDERKRQKLECLERTLGGLRGRFGTGSIHRGLTLIDKQLGQINPYDDHTIHPVGFF